MPLHGGEHGEQVSAEVSVDSPVGIWPGCGMVSTTAPLTTAAVSCVTSARNCERRNTRTPATPSVRVPSAPPALEGHLGGITTGAVGNRLEASRGARYGIQHMVIRGGRCGPHPCCTLPRQFATKELTSKARVA